MCLYPKLIRNPKYKINKKNGGKIPPIKDNRVELVPIGCGKCIECMKQNSRQWQIRLTEEIRINTNGKFTTLTFSEESIEFLENELELKNEDITEYQKLNEIATLAVRRFLERWRKKYKKSVRHWLVTELGHEGTERIHLHGIIFTDKCKEEIEERWAYGWIHIGDYVSERTINYITKYITKIDQDHKEYKPKVLTSSGIGKEYINNIDSKNNKYKGKETDETYRFRNGTKANLPIYYRNKIYSEEEREELWLQKLDKEERWICGEKIDISKGEEEYYKTLKYYQDKNKRLGYGDDKKTWEEKNYKKIRKRLRKIK